MGVWEVCDDVKQDTDWVSYVGILRYHLMSPFLKIKGRNYISLGICSRGMS